MNVRDAGRNRPVTPPSKNVMGFSLTVVTRSDVGRVRKRNEDAVASDPERGIVVVADGMGGHPSGDVASRIAAREALEILLEWEAPSGPMEAPEEGEHTPLGDRMEEAVACADESVRQAGRDDPEKKGMGTTLTALLVDTALGRWTMGHVGDSRGYRLREGRIEQMTRDDSWVQEQIEAGVLDREAARDHPWSSVLSQALGLDDPARPSVYEGTIQAGDVFLVCSDGLSGLVEDEEMRRLLTEDAEGDLDEAADLLVQTARERGGPDNITVGLVRVEDED